MRTASSLLYLTFSTLSACSTVTPPLSARLKEPLAPLMVTWLGGDRRRHALGQGTGAFATLLIT